MKIRIGYITNSSSTNFLILSKKEISVELLYKKLGFKKNSPLQKEAFELCENIIEGTQRGFQYLDINDLDYDTVLKMFGESTARKYKKYIQKGYNAYIGYTSSDYGTITSFFTTDSFEIDEHDFYVNARNCLW